MISFILIASNQQPLHYRKEVDYVKFEFGRGGLNKTVADSKDVNSGWIHVVGPSCRALDARVHAVVFL